MNWAMLVIALLVLAYFAIYVPSNRDALENVLRDIKTEVSAPAKLVLSIPRLAYPLVAGAMAITLLLVQRFSKSRVNATLFHMLVTAIFCVAVVAVHDVLIQPIITLMRALSGR